MFRNLGTWLLLCGLVNGLVSGASVLVNRDSHTGPSAHQPPTAMPRHQVTVEQHAAPANKNITRRDTIDFDSQQILEYSRFEGNYHQMSNALCTSGTIGNAWAKTFQLSIGSQTGFFHPTDYLKPGLEKIVPAGQLAVVQGAIATTTYSTGCVGGVACFMWFQPFVMAAKVQQDHWVFEWSGSLVSRETTGTATYHFPMTNTDCGGQDCGAAGIYGACYMVSFGNKYICPNTYPNQTWCDTKPAPKDCLIRCPDNFNPDLKPPTEVEDIS